VAKEKGQEKVEEGQGAIKSPSTNQGYFLPPIPFPLYTDSTVAGDTQDAYSKGHTTAPCHT